MYQISFEYLLLRNLAIFCLKFLSNSVSKHALKKIYLFRDGIQLLHDQTVRYMNKGLYPDEITRKVLLPPYLANHPFLQEFYGTVEWSIKAVFANYMGWFSGKVKKA